MNTDFKTIDEYISLFPLEIQKKLIELRKVIRDTAPEAVEKISWQMPTFYLKGNLVHFAAHQNHIGFYPGASGVEIYKNELTEYKTSKGAIQFPYKKSMPYELIKKIVKYRVAENLETAEKRDKK
jgi:uncharacterized protein YdhG (YjbR/CyaY superfamily)